MTAIIGALCSLEHVHCNCFNTACIMLALCEPMELTVNCELSGAAVPCSGVTRHVQEEKADTAVVFFHKKKFFF